MEKKEFSKFFVGTLKRTAQNVSPLVIKKQKLIAKKNEIDSELEFIQEQIEQYEAPIKKVTGGYGTEDLIERVVEATDKTDKNGNVVKVTKWNLRYPETIVPPTENAEPAEQPETEVVTESMKDTDEAGDAEPQDAKNESPLAW
jgi:hypothetical protein